MSLVVPPHRQTSLEGVAALGVSDGSTRLATGRGVVIKCTLPKDGRCFLVVNEDLFTSLGKGRMPMRRSMTQQAVMLAGVLAIVVTTILPLQPVFGEGGARRDILRQEAQNRTDALDHATEAVDHSKQGHTTELVAHAEAALQHALNGGKDRPHVDEGIAHLKAAIEHGKAGHADVATKHAETAVMHLSQGR
jgi:Small metal-binding protein